MHKAIELKKHSAIIQMSNRVTALQRKVFNALIHNARETLVYHANAHKFDINIAKIKSIAGLGATDYSKIKKPLTALCETLVRYNVLNKDRRNTEWRSGDFHLIAGIDFHSDGTIVYSFPHQLIDLILEPDIFSILDLNIIKGLQSKYSIALYELSKDYINAELPRMSIDVFRELMGIDTDKYVNFKDLRMNVIEPAIEEIKKGTDIHIVYEAQTMGRKAIGLKFTIRSQQLVIAYN